MVITNLDKSYFNTVVANKLVLDVNNAAAKAAALAMIDHTEIAMIDDAIKIFYYIRNGQE